MTRPSRYWTIWRFEAIEGGRIRTQGCQCDRAQAFFGRLFPQLTPKMQLSNAQEREIQTILLSAFRAKVSVSSPEEPELELNYRAIAGLCLRCYVSYDILAACHQIARQYSNRDLTSERLLHDLLPFALTDSGERLMVPRENSKEYRAIEGYREVRGFGLEGTGEPPSVPPRRREARGERGMDTKLGCTSQRRGRRYSDGANPDNPNSNQTDSNNIGDGKVVTGLALEILGSYQLKDGSKSLKSWTHLLVRQSDALRNVLLEHSIYISTPWSLLKKATSRQLETLPEGDRLLVEAFQEVYRRDWRTNSRRGTPCPPPSPEQLAEILGLLQPRGIAPDSPQSLIDALKKIADGLRQDEIWKRRNHPGDRQLNPLEGNDPETGDSLEYLTDPNSTVDSSQQEQRELLEFIYQQLTSALHSGIEEGIDDRTLELSQSRSYAPLAADFTRGLRLLYVQNLSQRQIALELGISNQSKVSRIFSPKALLFQVRFRTVDRLVRIVLDKARDLGLTRIPPEKYYLSNLVRQLEDFVDAEIFDEATSEIMAGKSRSLNSIYAIELRNFLSNK